MIDGFRRSVLSSIAIGAPLLTVCAARAQTTQPTPTSFDLQAMVTMLTNMGYVPKVDGQRITVIQNGNYDLTVYINGAGSNQYAIAYVYLQSYTTEDLKRLNMLGLLNFNDSSLTYFSLSKLSDGGYAGYLQRNVPVAAISPSLMRATLSTLASSVYASENLWNKAKWPQ